MDTVAKKLELESALPLLEKDLIGLHNMENDTFSNGLLVKIQKQITEHEQRRTLINAELKELNDLDSADAALVADGYPELADILLTDEENAELAVYLEGIKAASETFSLDQQAKSAKITFGQPVPKEPSPTIPLPLKPKG